MAGQVHVALDANFFKSMLRREEILRSGRPDHDLHLLEQLLPVLAKGLEALARHIDAQARTRDAREGTREPREGTASECILGTWMLIFSCSLLRNARRTPSQ